MPTLPTRGCAPALRWLAALLATAVALCALLPAVATAEAPAIDQSVSIRDDGVPLVDGFAVFPVGTYGFPYPGILSDFEGQDWGLNARTLTEAGFLFTQLDSAPHTYDDPNSVRRILSRSADHGLMVQWNLVKAVRDDRDGLSPAQDYIEATLQHVKDVEADAAWYGWMLLDEVDNRPDHYGFADVAEARDYLTWLTGVIRTADPNHVIAQNYHPSDPSVWDEFTPLVDQASGGKTYVVPAEGWSTPEHDNGHLSSIGDWSGIVREKVTANQGSYVYVEAAKGGGRFPTYGETRYLVYSSILNGARSVVFGGLGVWAGSPAEHADHLDQVIRPLLGEIGRHGEMNPVLAAREAAPTPAVVISPGAELAWEGWNPYTGSDQWNVISSYAHGAPEDDPSGSSLVDVEVRVTARPLQGGKDRLTQPERRAAFGVFLRGAISPPDDPLHYGLKVTNFWVTNMSFHKAILYKTGPSGTEIIAEAPFPGEFGDEVEMALRAEGDQLQAWVWGAGEPQPETPLLTAVDGDLSVGGTAGVVITENCRVHYDDFSVVDATTRSQVVDEDFGGSATDVWTWTYDTPGPAEGVWAVHWDEVQTSHRRVGAYGYVIAAKRENAPAIAEIGGITIKNGMAIVVGEGRLVPIVDSKITDWFEPNSVHVYRYLIEVPMLAPRIRRLRVLPRDDTSVRVTWETSEVSNSLVKWGPGPEYGHEILAEPGYVLHHEAVITDLEPWTTTYHLRARSDAGEGVTSFGRPHVFVLTPRPGDARMLRPEELEGTGAYLGVAWMRVEGSDGYRVHRRPHGTETWSVVATVAQANEVIEIAYPDPGATPGESFDYGVTAYHGSLEGPPSVWVEGTSGAAITAAPETGPSGVTVLRLEPAAPNPFNPRTTLRFALPTAGPVRLTVHDVSGRLVTTLIDSERPAGVHSVMWDGTNDAGAGVASGVYFTRMRFDGEVVSRKIVLQR